jgi:hypothetical protein
VIVAPLFYVASQMAESSPVDVWDLVYRLGLPLAMALGGLWAIVQGRVVTARELTAKDAEIARLVARHEAELTQMRLDHEHDFKEWGSRHAETIAGYESRLSRMDAGMARYESMLFEVVGLTRAVAGHHAAVPVPTEAQRGP